MNTWQRLLRKFRRANPEQELDLELRSHLEKLTQENIRSGLTAAEARRRALIELGGVEQVKEYCRDERRGALLDSLLQDARYALRQLRHNPGFATVAILTLALGIGANTAIFSVVDAVLLRPLPFAEPDRIVTLWQNDTKNSNEREDVSPANFLSWREQNTVFSLVAAINPWSLDYTGGDEPESIRSSKVTEGFFEVLGVSPILGRTFATEEFQEGRDQVVVLTHGIWQRKFGADRGIVGRTLSLDRKPYVVIGVLPADFYLRITSGSRPRISDMFSPEVAAGEHWQARASTYLEVIARMKPGVSVEAARAEMAGIAARLAQEFPRENNGMGISVIPLREQMIGGMQFALLMLAAAVGLVLLIACTNVANLQMARSVSRQREIAVRAALGAGAGRLARQLLTESALLAALGCAGGLLLARWAIPVITSLAPANTPRIQQAALNGGVMLFAAGVALLTVLAFGVMPALQLARVAPQLALREGAATGNPRGRHIGGLLIAFEVALSVVLLTTAGLIVRSFLGLIHQDRGFDQNNVAAFEVYVWDFYSTAERRIQYFQDVIAQLRSMPEVKAAAAVSSFPFLTSGHAPSPPALPLGSTTPWEQAPTVYSVVATPDYFRAMSLPLLSGRTFTEFDKRPGTPVAIVNTTMANLFWRGRDPIGQKFVVRLRQPVTFEIVGVVGDARHRLDLPPRPEFFLPHTQSGQGSMTLVVRTHGDPAAALPALKRQIWSVNNKQAFYNVATLDQLVNGSLSQQRFHLLLVGGFAVLGLVLAAVGIYGVMSFTASQRTREIGVRVALGASPSDVLRAVVGQGLLLALAGLAASLVVTRSLTRFLYGVTPADPITYVVVAALLLGVAALACYVPARRAMRVDPVTALRYE